MVTRDDAVAAWAGSGAMALTGRADGPALGPPEPLVAGLSATAAVVAARSGELGMEVRLDPCGLLAERAALSGLHRQGTTSCGGSSRLLRAADGWVAVTLAREIDFELVPAWLGREVTPTWEAIEAEVASARSADLVAQAALLGLPVAALSSASGPPCRAVELGERPAPQSLDDLVVVDLSALWAGPLAGSILRDTGATVVKVESPSRPDGARRGPPAFFDLMNAGKRCAALDLASDDGWAALAALITRADVVIEASRPRVLEQRGIDATTLLRSSDGPQVWVSITGHGREGVDRDRVGFGDDTAVAGGLVAWENDEPRFCADAVADPCAGLTAAAACLTALATGGTWLLDVSLAGVAADLAGPTLAVPLGIVAAPPAPQRYRGDAAELGAHTAEVFELL